MTNPTLQLMELIRFAIDLAPERFMVGATQARVSDIWFEYQRSAFFVDTKHERSHWLVLANFLKQR